MYKWFSKWKIKLNAVVLSLIAFLSKKNISPVLSIFKKLNNIILVEAGLETIVKYLGFT